MTPLLFYLFFALIGIIGLVDSFLTVAIYYRLPIVMQRSNRKFIDPNSTYLLGFLAFFGSQFNVRFGADLPYFTLMVIVVIAMSEWMQEYCYIGIVVVYDYFKKRSPKFNHFLDRRLLKLPVVGIILNKSAIARFARTLSTLSAAGLPLVEALESATGACGNIIYAEAVMKIREKVSMGQSLQAAMAQVGLFPHMVQQMIAIGEEAGSMDAMLSKVADLYEAEVDNLMNNHHSSLVDYIFIISVVILGIFMYMYLVS